MGGLRLRSTCIALACLCLAIACALARPGGRVPDAEYLEFLRRSQQGHDPVEAKWDTVGLVAEQCSAGPAYSTNLPPNMHNVTDAEHCHICKRIVHNSQLWNWKQHYSALCNRVPPHLIDLCKHYACKMAINCPEFIAGRCLADGSERFPCPAKYVCWNCLHIPSKQFAGCFDGLG